MGKLVRPYVYIPLIMGQTLLHPLNMGQTFIYPPNMGQSLLHPIYPIYMYATSLEHLSD